MSDQARTTPGNKEDVVPLEQHQRAVMNVMEMDMLGRSEEERAGLKQRVRELEGELDELRIGVLLVDDLACDLLSSLSLYEERGGMSQKSVERYAGAIVDELHLLVSKEDGDRLSKVISQRQRQTDRPK